MKTLLLFLAFTIALSAAPSKRPDVAPPVQEKQATVPVTTSVRITRIEVIAETSEGAKVLIWRERLQTLTDGTVLGRAPLPVIERRAESSSTDKVGSLTLDDWLNAVGSFAAKWAAEDAAAQLKLVQPKPPTT